MGGVSETHGSAREGVEKVGEGKVGKGKGIWEGKG